MTPRMKALKALNSVLNHFGMDEDEFNKPVFNQIRDAVDALADEDRHIHTFPHDVENVPPAIGSWWSHSNGDSYCVTGYADMFSDSHQRRPPRVIYRSQKTGRTWSRELSDWYRAMIPNDIGASGVARTKA